jgi:DNA-binding LytR/AlgR family response regulator
MLKVIAIDDEPMALEVVKNFAEKVKFLEPLAYFENALEAIDFLRQNQVDLMFLDIRMPDISGIEFLKTISNPPMAIFTTAHSEHALNGFEVNAVDYLLKPFSLPRFLTACNKAYEQFEWRKNFEGSVSSRSVFIKTGYEKIKVDLDDVLYVESHGNYMEFIMRDKKILSRLSMSEVESLLPAALFIRLHRSYIVSKKHITKIEKRSIWINETEFSIGSGYLKEFEKLKL